MCQRHRSDQTPTLLFESKNHVSIHLYNTTYAVEEFLSVIPNSVILWSLQQNVFFVYAGNIWQQIRHTGIRYIMMTSSNGNIFRVINGPLSPVNSPHKGQWRGALIFSLICAWINGLANKREAGNYRRHRAHHDIIVMFYMNIARLQFIDFATELCFTNAKNVDTYILQSSNSRKILYHFKTTPCVVGNHSRGWYYLYQWFHRGKISPSSHNCHGV